MKPINFIISLPLFALLVLLTLSLVNFDQAILNYYLHTKSFGLDEVRIEYVEDWLTSLGNIVDMPIILNEKPRPGYLNFYTEIEEGAFFSEKYDAVYMPESNAIVVSRGLIDKGTNYSGIDDYEEHTIQNAEDSLGYQMFIFVLLHEIGHSKEHSKYRRHFSFSRYNNKDKYEIQADEFAAQNVLNAPYGYILFYKCPETEQEKDNYPLGYLNFDCPKCNYEEDEDSCALAKFSSILQTEWLATVFPENSKNLTKGSRINHINLYFNNLQKMIVEERLQNAQK